MPGRLGVRYPSVAADGKGENGAQVVIGVTAHQVTRTRGPAPDPG